MIERIDNIGEFLFVEAREKHGVETLPTCQHDHNDCELLKSARAHRRRGLG